MSDFLVDMGQNPQARRLIKRLGLPIPLPEKLRRPKGPWAERPLHDRAVVCALPAGAAMAGAIAEALPPAGANATVVGDDAVIAPVAAAGEAFGRPIARLASGEPSDLRADGLVFDGSGIEDVAGLRALYEFFNPWVKQVAKCGRVVVVGRPPDGLAPAAAAAQMALDGFTRSIAKEIGKNGSTANLVYVDTGAEDRLAPVLTFLLSEHSAFVSGQPLHVSRVAAAEEAPRHAVRSLEGKVALVTGAARGIGAATARRLAGEGAHVVCLDRPADDTLASQLAREIKGSVLLADVSEEAAAADIAAELERRFGGVDVVVHNAGITRDKTVARMSGEQWDQVLGVNLAAILRITEPLAAGVLCDGGRIVCLSSIGGIAGNVGQTNYCATKAGVIGWVRAQSSALGKRGITVNAVAPGFIETRLTAAIPVAFREVARRMSSLRQGGLPEDVADVITFLSLPAAAGLSGNVIRVCGQALVGA